MNNFKSIFFTLTITLISFSLLAQNETNSELYRLNTGIKSRSISFENPTGEPGMGGKASNKQLGVGRKGFPSKSIEPGETVVLCDIKSSGIV